MPDFIQPSHSSFVVKATQVSVNSENKTADLSDSSYHPLLKTDLPSTRLTEQSNIADSNSITVSHRHVSVNTASPHSLLTLTEAQDFAPIPEGPSFLLLFPEEHLFLLFADPDAIISRCSPQEYEAREPKCTSAWCRGMSQVLDWIQHDPVDAPLISQRRYMQINYLLTDGVDNMLSSHIPGATRKGSVFYGSKDHTHKGVIQALEYKQRLEENYEFCRGTRNATIVLCSKSTIIPDSTLIWVHNHKNQYPNYTNLEGVTIRFRTLGPDNSESGETTSDDILFKYQLLVLLEKEIIIPLNRKLKSLQNRAIAKPELLEELINILAKYWPRLEQIHPPTDGTCRTNYMLMQYIFMKFGFPPPVLRDPNSIDLVHTSLCKRIIGIGLQNSLRLMDQKDQVLEAAAIVDRYTTRYLKKSACFFLCGQDYEKYLIPDELNFSDQYIAQMRHLTKEFIEVLNQFRTSAHNHSRLHKTPLHIRKKS